jgi:hypothetical protein
MEYTDPKRKYRNTVQKYKERRNWPFGNEQAIKTNGKETEPQTLRSLAAKLNVRAHALFCLSMKHDTIKRRDFSIRTYGVRNKNARPSLLLKSKLNDSRRLKSGMLNTRQFLQHKDLILFVLSLCHLEVATIRL